LLPGRRIHGFFLLDRFQIIVWKYFFDEVLIFLANVSRRIAYEEILFLISNPHQHEILTTQLQLWRAWMKACWRWIHRARVHVERNRRCGAEQVDDSNIGNQGVPANVKKTPVPIHRPCA
jgi:hypothetical protein